MSEWRRRLPWSPLKAALRRAAARDGISISELLDIYDLEKNWHRSNRTGVISEVLADRICCNILRVNPTAVYGDDWLCDDLDYARIQARIEASDPTVKHGTVWVYNRGCRCDECKAAGAAYRRKRRERAQVA